VSADEEGPGGDAAQQSPAVSGPDLARAALAQAKARAAERGAVPRSPRPRRAVERPGSGRDARDPVLFGAAIARLVAERGWESTTSAGRVMGEWDVLVGAEIAEHCRPASLLEGELVLVAESSAWATQLRLMSAQLVRRLTAQVGPGVVKTLVVRGPAQPDWRRGPRRVQGRGPRDTYG
jgi:predicted nucleic acid-binding Zn ribbon protein